MNTYGQMRKAYGDASSLPINKGDGAKTEPIGLSL